MTALCWKCDEPMIENTWSSGGELVAILCKCPDCGFEVWYGDDE
jgi:hypothetical protein